MNWRNSQPDCFKSQRIASVEVGGAVCVTVGVSVLVGVLVLVGQAVMVGATLLGIGIGWVKTGAGVLLAAGRVGLAGVDSGRLAGNVGVI